ncbi:hypothetical protein ACI79C_14145 [Geodermatophilus sp. SYSU D00697]
MTSTPPVPGRPSVLDGMRVVFDDTVGLVPPAAPTTPTGAGRPAVADAGPLLSSASPPRRRAGGRGRTGTDPLAFLR